MEFLQKLRTNIPAAKIIFAEAEDARVTQAAWILEQQSDLQLCLIGDDKKIRALCAHPLKAEILSYEHIPEELKVALVNRLVATKRYTSEQAVHTLSTDSKYLAAALVAQGYADGFIAGNMCTTAETIRPALQLIGSKSFASSYFIMLKEKEVLFFADAAFNIKPTIEQLADIAIATAHSAQEWGIASRVAFLSFSTYGSANHPEVDFVRSAMELARTKSSGIPIDGPLQFDAAYVPDIGAMKAPGSEVAGKATVYIFPDLTSANISYKLAERVGGMRAVGPILQGFNRPVNDLSRGCSVDDIVDVAIITARQAQKTSETR